MEIAVNINKKLWSTILDEFKVFNIDLTQQKEIAREKIHEILMNHSRELINVKAIDQVLRRLVIADMIAKRPKIEKSKEDKDFDDIRHKLHKARKSKSWKMRGDESMQHSSNWRNRSAKW